MLRRGLAAAGIAVIAALAMPSAASAVRIIVNVPYDEYGGAIGSCSLREAVQAANGNGNFDGCSSSGDFDHDTIVLGDGLTYIRDRTGTGDDTNAVGDIDVGPEPLTIVVDDGGPATIQGTDAGGGDRLLDNRSTNLSITGVEFTNGRSPAGSGESGGAIRNFGTLTVRNSTFAGNQSVNYGGALENAAGGTATIVNSTFSANSAGAVGGAIDTDTGSVTVNGSTIVGNSAADVFSSGEGGGGLYAFGSGSITLSNTILDANTDTSVPGPSECDAAPTASIVSAGWNLVGTTAGCAFTPAAGDLTGVASQVGPLANNTGPTRTRAIPATSPAVNAGNPALPDSSPAACAGTDQRGVARPQGGRCDIGAFEVAIKAGGPVCAVPKSFRCSFAKPCKKRVVKKKGKRKRKCIRKKRKKKRRK